jgi:predicted TPR repeat methyltransferase
MPQSHFNIEQSLRDALSLHAAGRARDAAALYRQILVVKPEHSDSLRLLGVIAMQDGRIDEAETLIRRSIASDPRRAEGYHNLGDALRRQKKLDEAITCYKKAIELQPNWAEAHGALGDTLREQGKLDQAAEEFKKVIDLKPEFAAGHLAMAKVLAVQGERAKAMQFVETALRLRPNYPDAHDCKGNVLWDEGRMDDAIAAYSEALRIDPSFVPANWHMGKILVRRQRIDEALVYVQRAVQLNPKNAGAYAFLGTVLARAGRKEEAMAAFREGIRLDPNAQAWKFRMSALSGDGKTKTAPMDYVRGLFDEYAPTFEKHLVEKLHYRAPEQILEAVKRATQRADLDVLDAGCGTGLCGQQIRPLARRLVGVDLSAAMITEAKQRGVYDELINAEIVQTMRDAKEEYDLIMAGDVLIYIGDLAEFMPAAAGALRSGGMLACSIETYYQEGFILHSEERFAHSLGYMWKMASASGLKEISATPVPLRRHGDLDVPGHIVVIGKT